MKIARRGNISPFKVMEALREANAYEASGGDPIHLSLGQPGETAPRRVREKVAALLLDDAANTGYTEAMGLFPLRQRIAQHYQDFYGLYVSPERILVTVGSSSAMNMTLLSAFDYGDKVALALPCYPAYPNMLEALGLEPVFMRATIQSNFQPTLEMLKALPEKPDGLILASPSNPTGTIIPEAELKAIAQYCEANGIRLISDEIYHGVTYENAKGTTALSLSDHAIVINSFSKYFLLPGWRLGWAVIPEDLMGSYDALVQNFFLSPSAISQYAALEVFNCMDELNAVVKNYARNRAILLEELPKAGFELVVPAEGAFYIYANVSKLTNDSAQFCKNMLHETGVVAVSGLDFDREEGSQYVRFSFAGKESEVAEAMKRLQSWLA